ncbi:hypothetical protein C4K00_1844 [Pseudomonas synxantha]|uniref:Uncharacterized protein n=2 Tax=Pseudomonas fluorescens group TaxID=136843 RepID=A0ABR5MA26_9PSED|nr:MULTISPECIES: hypothetical protein [Pseudomonas]AKA81970.1 hypothetical protein VO64_1424 [Pseudomonas synxantha]AMS21180.1 hypothetical protein AYK59_13875 [Pseudomonas synxantha]AZE72083.1 hypothetical protein C4K00_1844 [Pseudomonas synxantha]KPG75799.1 hypothetical protein AEQ48_08985 [Pseudomonas libanensis]MDT3231920.1 hypothetical protein [Pseudomonas sp. rhizo25]
MRQGVDQGYLESDDYKAYKEIEEQIGLCTPEQAWAMYYVSTGMVRENITLAVMEHIGRGNRALLLEFPDLVRVEGRNYEPGALASNWPLLRRYRE